MAQPYPIWLAVGQGQRWIAILARNCMNIDMAQMNVSLPEGLKAWAEARVAEGRYSSTSDYVRDLMRRDMEAAEARRRLEAEIGRASCRERGCQYVSISVGDVSI